MIVNTVLVTGTLLGDPEFRLNNFGCPFLILKLSSKLPYVDALGNMKEKDNFFCAVAHDDLATQCRDLAEGDEILIEGRLISHEWQENGATVSSMKIHAEIIQRR